MTTVLAAATAVGVVAQGAGAVGAVGCLIVRELSSQAFSLTLTQLMDVMSAIRRNPEDVTQLVHDELISIVPTAKLNIIKCVLCDFEWMRQDSKTINALCNRLTELAQSIRHQVKKIDLAVDTWNERYFRRWFSLDVSTHFKIIKQDVHELNETFELLKVMLPSCLSLQSNKYLKKRSQQHQTSSSSSLGNMENNCTSLVLVTKSDILLPNDNNL